MKTSIDINIDLIKPDEVFIELPGKICTDFKLSHTRYLISNYSRIYDMTTERIILVYPSEDCPYYILRTLSNTIIRIDMMKIHLYIDHDFIHEYIWTHDKSICGFAILDRDLVMYIRSAYYSKERTNEELLKELNISRFSLGFAVNEDFVKFENSCEIRDNNMRLSLEVMEAVDTLTSKDPNLRITKICDKICKKLGIQRTQTIYNKISNYAGGRSGYIYIPKNVQRLVN